MSHKIPLLIWVPLRASKCHLSPGLGWPQVTILHTDHIGASASTLGIFLDEGCIPIPYLILTDPERGKVSFNLRILREVE